ncbi:MAG: DUF2004 domain-containing protein [Hymenobacter sp.]|nr:MAG: DUF2004 domain-containing protein [Hymenobacter sp.]
MATFTLPFFGQLELNSLEEYYSTKIEFNETIIGLDLNFEDKNITLSKAKIIKKFINNILEFDLKNKTYIQNDYKDADGDTVKFYLEFHLEELDKQELAKIIDFNNVAIEPEQQLLNKLRLVRLGFYPNDDDIFAVFDYSFGKEITNQLVVVNINNKGKLYYLTMES